MMDVPSWFTHLCKYQNLLVVTEMCPCPVLFRLFLRCDKRIFYTYFLGLWEKSNLLSVFFSTVNSKRFKDNLAVIPHINTVRFMLRP